MVGSSESMVITSMWASMAAWFTPTVLFCVTNLIIATIFIASNNNNNHKKSHDHVHGDSLSRIARVSSFLDRARSVNSSSYTTTTNNTTAQSQPQYPSQLKTANYSSSSRLAQSIHFSSNYVTPPELSNGDKLSPPESEQLLSQTARAPSLFERVKSIKSSSVHNENEFPAESEQICNSPGQLVRAPSFLDRVKSFRISSTFISGAPSTQPENVNTVPVNNQEHHVIRSKSEKTSAKKSLVEMKKSRSEMRIVPDDEEDVKFRRPATARERRNAVDEEVDAKADDFISRFKQQLKLQRLESLVRYNAMLNRRSYD